MRMQHTGIVKEMDADLERDVQQITEPSPEAIALTQTPWQLGIASCIGQSLIIVAHSETCAPNSGPGHVSIAYDRDGTRMNTDTKAAAMHNDFKLLACRYGKDIFLIYCQGFFKY